MAKSMAKDCSCGETIVAMMEISAKTTSKVKANIVGKMVEFTKVNGLTIKCKAMVFSHGLTVENIRGNI